MKILAFAASNSRNSINRALIDFASARLRADILPNVDIKILDLNDYEMPIYSIDRERDAGIPALAHEFYRKIGAADAILVSFAEHNEFVTSAWKNIFDWMSRIEMKLWQSKAMVMLAASPGRCAGQNVLESQKLLSPHFGADLRAALGIGKWPEAWDPDTKSLLRAQDVAALDAALAKLLPQDAESEDAKPVPTQ